MEAKQQLDESAIHNLVEKLQTLQTHMEAVDQAKSHFLHSVARKLRTPLNHILGMTQLLLSNSHVNAAEKKDMLEIIFRSSNEMLMLVGEIQDYAGLDTGQLALDTETVNLENTLEKTIGICAASSADKKINLLLDYPQEIPREVKGDPRRIRQIISNLIDNAIKFSNAGEILVKVGIIGNPGMVQVSVIDQGVGIEPQQLKQLLGEGLDDIANYSDMGYGLAVVKKLVKLMDGELTATSQLGEGATFSFTLPLAETNVMVQAQATESTNNNTAVASLAGVKILLADDNNNRAAILAERLTALDAEMVKLPADQILTALREALHTDKPFQIVVVSQQDFNHHAAYIARTIKSTPALRDVMLVLALVIDLADYELDQALLTGYTTVSHSLQPSRFANELSCSWQSWSADGTTVKRTALSLPRILVVEDDTLSQKVTKLMLEDLGCQVDIADTGNKALQLLETNTYHLVLMDIGLPDISGLEVTSKFRHRDRGIEHYTPIVALTAHALEQTAHALQEVGMDGYLAKPLLQEKLRILLSQWVFKYQGGIN